VTEAPFVQDVRQYLAVFHKRRALMITSLGVSMLVAVLYNYTTRPLYKAFAQILIDRDAPKVLPTAQAVDQGIQDYATEYEMLRGRTLAEKVVERLSLQHNAELATGPLMSPWERLERQYLGRAPVLPIDADGLPLSPTVAAVRSRLTVEPLPGGRLVNLRFTAYDPKVAADLANALAELYIEHAQNLRYTSSSEATGWLAEQLKEQKRKVEDAERALLTYEERQGLVGMSNPGTDDSDNSLESTVLAARTERIAKEAQLGQVRSLPPSQLASVPVIAGNVAVQDARRRVNELQADVARLGETLGDKHPEMVRLRGELDAAHEKLQSEVRGAMRVLEGEAQAARAKEANLEASLDRARHDGLVVSRKAIEWNALKREVESNKQIFQSLMSRSKETGLQSELKATGVRIVERAEPPRGPASPNRSRNYRIALLVGLVLGIVLALLFEHADNTVKTPEDLKQLGLPFLGMVPAVAPQGGGGSPMRPQALKNPEGAVAEAYRVLRTNLLFSMASDGSRALLVTSPNPGEGKTTTAANLAGSLALNGAKVLLVDADLRRPTLHQHFGIQRSPGLSDLIVGKFQPSDVVQGSRFRGVHVIPCGYVPPNPAELLGSAAMREIVKALKTRYDWVIIDTPPILAMADTPVLCPYVDGVVLVVAAEVSGRPGVQRALDQIQSVGGKLLGVVLNKVDLRRNSYYYSQYYGEYYRSYYADAAVRGVAAAKPRPRPVRRS
jgi:capsular exopolysaccharide synthesis family protein